VAARSAGVGLIRWWKERGQGARRKKRIGPRKSRPKDGAARLKKKGLKRENLWN
jgi:hypothetical protein